jgi:hypothetical protein
MEKEFVTYELALRMKVLGFNEMCFTYFMDGFIQPSLNPKDYTYFDEMSSINKNMLNYLYVLAPTWQSAFDWFGDKYQLYPSIVVDQTSYPKYAFEISKFIGNPKDLTEKEWYWDDMILSPNLYRTKTEARLYCLNELLNIVEKKGL